MMREDFPQLKTGIKYFDNAATTLRPQAVIQSINDFYCSSNANARRGLYSIAVEAEQKVERCRENIAKYLNANTDEIIFTHGATESLNLVAHGLSHLYPGAEVIFSRLEHHSNILPWREHFPNCKILECDQNGKLEDIFELISERTKILAISAESNVLGKIPNFEETIRAAKTAGLIVVVDATQAIAHQKIDISALDADFVAFSGHKIYGPMGVGVLFGKKSLLDNLPPLLYGGEMVESVSDNHAELAEPPFRFEAGTQNIASIVGLDAALRFLTPENFQHEQSLARKLREQLSSIPELTIYGKDGTIVSFNIDGVHPHDVAAILDSENFAIRAGYHCAQPLLDKLGFGPCCRASLSFHNTEEEIEEFVKVVSSIRKRMGL